MAEIKVASYCEEPRTEARLRMKILATRNQSQPRFFQQVFGDGTVLRHSREKAQETMVEDIVDLVKGADVPCSQSDHQRDFEFPLHKDITPWPLNRDTVTFQQSRRYSRV